MKKLQDLKQEILEGKINNFYVFYGEDYGIRKHYIDKLSTFFPSTITADKFEDIRDIIVSKSLFSIKRLIVIYDDRNFAKSSNEVISTFIKRLKDYCVIFVYEEELPNTNLFKNFSDYITYFPIVQNNIALEFVEGEVSILQSNKEELIKNCENNYNNILLESNKIKNLSQAENITQENAYESLNLKGQLLEKYDEFNSNLFMNDVLSGLFTNIPYWFEIVNNNESNKDKFYFSLTSMLLDSLIAYLIVKYR